MSEIGLPSETVASGEALQERETTVGPLAAIAYALVAHRLHAFYDHGHWMTRGQAALMASEWAMRNKLSLRSDERRVAIEVSEEVAAQIRDTASREAGLFTANELQESLDPRYESDVGLAIKEFCAEKVREAVAH